MLFLVVDNCFVFESWILLAFISNSGLCANSVHNECGHFALLVKGTFALQFLFVVMYFFVGFVVLFCCRGHRPDNVRRFVFLWCLVGNRVFSFVVVLFLLLG